MLNMARSAVEVVPILAPMMIGTAFSRLSIPCWVRMMARPVVTELDCTMAVNRKPMKMPRNTFCGCTRYSTTSGICWIGCSAADMRFRLKNTKPK